MEDPSLRLPACRFMHYLVAEQKGEKHGDDNNDGDEKEREEWSD
jgi:hypothetical protein